MEVALDSPQQLLDEDNVPALMRVLRHSQELNSSTGARRPPARRPAATATANLWPRREPSCCRRTTCAPPRPRPRPPPPWPPQATCPGSCCSSTSASSPSSTACPTRTCTRCLAARPRPARSAPPPSRSCRASASVARRCAPRRRPCGSRSRVALPPGGLLAPPSRPARGCAGPPAPPPPVPAGARRRGLRRPPRLPHLPAGLWRQRAAVRAALLPARLPLGLRGQVAQAARRLPRVPLPGRRPLSCCGGCGGCGQLVRRRRCGKGMIAALASPCASSSAGAPIASLPLMAAVRVGIFGYCPAVVAMNIRTDVAARRPSRGRRAAVFEGADVRG
jgi:hypothetical protein